MASRLDRAASATCAVYIDGERTGSGVLVAGDFILTAAHNLGVPSAGDTVIGVRFLNEPDEPGWPCRLVPVEDETAAARLDFAVLHLNPAPERSQPTPIEIWPARRNPAEVHVFGYPLGEGAEPLGIWRQFRVAGAVRGGKVQLDWDVVGSLAGHSGGPVCDSAGLLAGILVAGSEQGHFDRMVPIHEIRRIWPGLPASWLFAGEDARTHFAQRAAGQRSIAQGGDLFQGRVPALGKTRNWLDREQSPQVPLVVTAQPGAGKSAVVARTAVLAAKTGKVRGVAFHARGARQADLTDAIAAACGIDTPESGSFRELMHDLNAMDAAGRQRLVVIVDALDEAIEQEIPQLRKFLKDLARLDWVTAVVATRALQTGQPDDFKGSPFKAGPHLHDLGVTRGKDGDNVIDLDSNQYFDFDDLCAYAAVLLTQTGFTNPGPREHAWETYRQDPQRCTRLAKAIAERAGRNYLVAGMAAFQLAEDQYSVDPRSPQFDPDTLPSGVDEALAKHMQRLPVDEQRQQRALLTALAYGRGAGLDDRRWLSFAQALGYEATRKELTTLRETPAVDYLLETKLEAEGKRVTRLFHQALVDELLFDRNITDDEQFIVEVLRGESAGGSWLGASPYAREHAPDHAWRAETLSSLLEEPDFLVGIAPSAMRSAVRRLTVTNRAAPGAIYDLSAPFLEDDAGRNAAVLRMVCSVQGNEDLARGIADLALPCPWRVTVHLRPLDTALARFEGHAGQVWSAIAVPWPELDHQLVVTTSDDKTALVWDPLRPEVEFARFDRHQGSIQRAAALAWPGLKNPAVITASKDQTARVWDPYEDGAELACFNGHTGDVTSIAVLNWPGLEHPVVVTTSTDGTARIWDPLHPDTELARFDGHAGAVWGAAPLDWPSLDHQVVVTAAADGTARIWDPLHPGTELGRFDGHTGAVSNITTLVWPSLNRPVVVTTSTDTADGTVRIWDPLHPASELACFRGHSAQVRGVTVLDWPGLGHPAIVSTATDGAACVWDPLQPDTELARFDGHTGAVWGAAALTWPGLDHPVVVTASEDGTARVWDPQGPDAMQAPFPGHSGPVEGLAALAWPGLDHSAVVTTSTDRTARVWDPLQPGSELARFTGHTAQIRYAAALDWPGLDHPVVVTTSADRTARVWDPLQPDTELARFDSHTNHLQGVATLDWPGLDHRVIVTGSNDGTARVWDPLQPGTELARFDGHSNGIQGVATLAWPGFDHSVVVTASYDVTARVWDPLRPSSELARFTGHKGPVRSVLGLPWPDLDHPVVVTTSDDGTARVWDPLTPDTELSNFSGHNGRVWNAAALAWPGRAHPVVITTSADATARVWDPRFPAAELAMIPLISTGYAVTVVAPLTVVVTTSRGFVTIHLEAD
jgi:WD40 repeat protein